MNLFIFLTVVQAVVAAALVGVILIQKSEGGGLGVGGSPSGLMSARGAADFLTRTTTILATLFVVLSIALGVLAVQTTSGREIDTSLQRDAGTPPAPPPAADPLAAPAQAPAQAPVQQQAPAQGPAQQAPLDPLKGATGQ